MTKTYCKIGGVNILQDQVVEWRYTSGVAPNELRITVPRDDAKAIMRRRVNELTIEFTNPLGEKVEIKNLTAVELNVLDYFYSMVTIVDYRYFIQYLKWVGRYNMKRVVNEYEIVPNAPRAARDWWLYPEYTWLYHTVKDGTPPDWENQNPPRGTPYNTLELLDMMMSELFGELYGGIIESENFDTPALDDMEFIAEPVTSMMQLLMRYSRANIAYFHDNKFYVYCIDDNYGWDKKLFEWQKKFRTTDDLHELEYHKYYRMVPEIVRIYMRLEKEIVIEVGNKKASTVTDALIYPDARNVTIIPRNMKINGKYYKRGTYIEIEKLLEYLGITEEDVRWAWRTPWSLIAIYCKKKGYHLQTFYDEHPLIVQLLMKIKSDYRTLYQIDPGWMAKILTLKPVRAAMIDYVTGTRQPSMVWSNYSGAYMIRISAEYLKRKGKDWGFHRYNAPYNKTAETIIRETDEAVAAGLDVEEKLSNWEVTVVNEKLGIIRFTPISDLHMEVIEYFPCILDNMPKTAIQKSPSFWEECNLNENHRAITVMTAIFSYPNSPEQLYYVDIPTNELGFTSAQFPEKWEFFTNRMNARQNYKGEIVNEEIVKNLAKAEAIKALRNVRDRIEGSVTLGGKFKIDHFGYCKEISYIFKQGGIETKIYIPPAPPPIELYSLLGKDAKKIFGHLEKE